MDINILFPIRVDSAICFMDLAGQKVYDSSGLSLDESITKNIFAAMKQKQESLFVPPPSELIKEVLDTQKDIGGPDVRGF